MSITVHQFPCRTDNYGFLVRDDTTGLAACIDTPEVAPIMRELESLGWRLAYIFNTHWHGDHTGGNAEIQAATGCEIIGPAEVRKNAPLDREVSGGERIMLGDTPFDVMAVGGHTLQHVAYNLPNDHAAFVGDTMFALGCGRLTEGDAPQMWTSLQRLAALPDDTLIYCAHEYTASNARFALTVDDAEALKQRALETFAARERGEPTVPSRLGLEKATNPFLRAPLLAASVGAAGLSDVEAFAAMRKAKDVFAG
ncbi:hydroxyacylglutathione hydrolase [Phenylobacterium immobile]|uniref:hydroxyacylglutathione hydrolase n=1 Tax=Phenylobacterium immobile TaxID=21 RepID=UPI000AF7A9F9|nr:hydroxyacylglutathione hydrolase [Phenylobacterium immobile]